MAEKLTAQQRANLFVMSTRQNLHNLAKQTVTQGATSMQFTLPKARLLSNVLVTMKAKVKVAHATKTEVAINPLNVHRLINRYSIDLNNGFMPYSISGEGAFLLNAINPTAKVLFQNSAYYHCPEKLVASPEGTVNELKFTVQLPVTLNRRDPIGLILLQSESTVVDLRMDVANAVNMFTENMSGYTFNLESLEALPMIETFSVPASANAYPDLSVLKLCQDRTDTITSAGQQIVKMQTGTIYRKIILYITDENGKPATEDFVQSNLEIVFNQADCNISVNPVSLRALNAFDLGTDIPEGVYIFDFSNQGTPNYSGTRDYIDSEKLTEMWLRFNAKAQGKVKIITECLARLV